MSNSFSNLRKAIDYMKEGRAREAGQAFASAIKDDEIENIYSFLLENENMVSVSSSEEEEEDDDEDETYIKSIIRLSVEKGQHPSRFGGMIKSPSSGPLKIKQNG